MRVKTHQGLASTPPTLGEHSTRQLPADKRSICKIVCGGRPLSGNIWTRGYWAGCIQAWVLPQVHRQHGRRDRGVHLLVSVGGCHDGLGDHDLVTAQCSLKPSVHKQKPRRVQLFKKADWPKLKTTYRNKRIDISIIKTVLQLNEPVTNSDDFNVGGGGSIVSASL